MRLRLILCLLVVLPLVLADGAAAGPLRTGVYDIRPFTGPQADTAFSRVRGLGASVVRLTMFWDQVAPTAPADASNPGDPTYQWDTYDRQIHLATAHGLDPLVTILRTPGWAGGGAGGSTAPDPGQLAAFASAAARRYSGSYDPDGSGPTPVLPRISLWEVWNEPNLPYYFMPQRTSGRSVAPDLYRNMVNAFSAAVHGVDASNVVVAGGLAPFGHPDGHMALDFMRKLLCISGRSSPKPVCSTRVAFDVWSHHPYTQGGPTHSAYWPDDVSIGDLPEMRRVLRAAVRAGHVSSSRRVGFWVTEFSWESNPPDPLGIRARVHARWTAEGLYRMWRSGVELVTWILLRDQPFPAGYGQSGFYYCGARTGADDGVCLDDITRDARKGLTIRAFRFPFVAFPRNGKLFVWGRTPAGMRGRVVVQLRTARGWRRLATLRADQYGIFRRTLRVSAAGRMVRARLVGRKDASLAFRAQQTRDIPLIHPFGCGGGLPC
jgi:hypothetical protein